MNPIVTCPECDSDIVRCVNEEYSLYECKDCGETFSEEEDIELSEKSSRYRTKPRRSDYDDD